MVESRLYDDVKNLFCVVVASGAAAPVSGEVASSAIPVSGMVASVSGVVVGVAGAARFMRSCIAGASLE